MYFEGSRDMYSPLIAILFAGSEEEITKTAEPRIDKFLPIYEKVRLIIYGTLP